MNTQKATGGFDRPTVAWLRVHPNLVLYVWGPSHTFSTDSSVSQEIDAPPSLRKGKDVGCVAFCDTIISMEEILRQHVGNFADLRRVTWWQFQAQCAKVGVVYHMTVNE